MARILAIDYGQKRIGIAVTDSLQMIANGLTTIETPKIYSFLAEYFTKEEVETIVVGYPKTLQNEPAEVTKYINTFVGKLRKLYPDKKIELIDERFTSKMAFQTMIDNGSTDLVDESFVLASFFVNTTIDHSLECHFACESFVD